MASQISAAELGALGKEAFLAKLSGVYENSPWVSKSSLGKARAVASRLTCQYIAHRSPNKVVFHAPLLVKLTAAAAAGVFWLCLRSRNAPTQWAPLRPSLLSTRWRLHTQRTLSY